MPQGAAGPERGVEMPNLTTSAAHEGPELATTSAAAAKSVPEARGTHCFIAITSWSAGRTSIARNYRDAGRPCQTLSPRLPVSFPGRRARDPADDSVGVAPSAGCPGQRDLLGGPARSSRGRL